MTIEQRRVHAGVEIRRAPAEGAPEGRADTATGTLAGYAAVFSTRADIAGLFTEEIAPGAFAESLANGDPRALYQHDTARPLARLRRGTLRAREDERGLAVEIDLPGSAGDVLEAVERGDVDGMSIGFFVTSEEWTDLDSDKPHRVIRGVDLLEVSPVTFPAYVETEIGVRAEDAERARRDLEVARLAAAVETDAGAEAAAEPAADPRNRSDRNEMARRLMSARLD